jgi:hypothetical protein
MTGNKTFRACSFQALTSNISGDLINAYYLIGNTSLGGQIFTLDKVNGE